MQLEAAGEGLEVAVEKIGLRSDPSGAGIQGDFPFDKDPKSLASKVINECPRLRKAVDGKSESDSRDILIGKFSTMRRAVERSVETVLLNDVVKRYDPAIHAANIVGLAKITKDDCLLLDRLMCEYSREIHDQADELDNAPLNIDELESDAKTLKEWIEEFRKRSNK